MTDRPPRNRKLKHPDEAKPFLDTFEPLEQLRDLGVVSERFTTFAARETLSAIGCAARRGAEITSYNTSACTGITRGKNQTKVLERFQHDGLLSEPTQVPPPEGIKYHSRPRMVYHVAEAAAALITTFPLPSACTSCPFREIPPPSAPGEQ